MPRWCWCGLVWLPYGFSCRPFLQDVLGDPKVTDARRVAARRPGPHHVPRSSSASVSSQPGLYFKSPIDQGLARHGARVRHSRPAHILMRSSPCRRPSQARKSVVWAMAIIGGFYVLTLFLGFGAGKHVARPAIAAVDAGGNMAGPRSRSSSAAAELVPRQLHAGFVSAVAFATIVAVVAGPGARGGLSHRARPVRGRVSRGDTVPPAAAGARCTHRYRARGRPWRITIGIAAKGQNVAHLVAARVRGGRSANFPCVLLTL